MSVELIPLGQLLANPYQTRQEDDPAHVAQLAESIRANGLLQIPSGRRVAAERVELAFGHSRLAAYLRLFEQQPLDGPEAYSAMPINVLALTDRQMADMAAAENAARKNLSAIETARALERRIDEFGLTQAEAGRPFGLTASAVANLLRLLKLPAEVQADVHAGALPERLARQLVRVAEVDPKGVERLSKKIAQAEPHEREWTLTTGLGDVLEDMGLKLDGAPWPTSWPEIVIGLNGSSVDALTELRPCDGCPHAFRQPGGWRDEVYCLLPACFQLKTQRYPAVALATATKKTGIPALEPGEKVEPLFAKERYDYTEGHDAARLVKAPKKDKAALGLRLCWLDKARYLWRDVTGNDRIGLAATSPAAVKAFLAAKDAAQASEKASAPAAEVDEELKEQRRAEAAAKLRVEADVVWLVQRYTEIVADQLTINGPVLAYVVERLLRHNHGQASDFFGLIDWYRDLENRAGKQVALVNDQLRRQMIVAQEVFEHLPFGGPGKADFDVLADKLADLARANPEDRITLDHGFGAKLPKGWSTPPIHTTEYNCWHCGTFAPQRTIPKYLLERGWVVEQEGDVILDVQCDECAKQPAPKKGAKKKA